MTLIRFGMHVHGVKGGEERGLPVETEPRPGSFKFLPFFFGSDGRYQDGEVADAKRNAILDGTWVTTTNWRGDAEGKRSKDQSLTTRAQERAEDEMRLWLAKRHDKDVLGKRELLTHDRFQSPRQFQN